jgi:hypothetical protein
MGVGSRYKNGRLQFHSGAIDDESVGSSTAASTAHTNYGVTRITSSQNAVFKFDTPVLGARKTIIVSDSTWANTLLFTGASINNATFNKITVTLSSVLSELGYGIDLYGASTVLWYMRQGNVDINSSQVTVTFAAS